MGKLRIVGLILFVFLMAGCDKVTTEPKGSQHVEKTAQSIDYAQLSDSEKSEMTFTFVKNDTSTAIDMKIVNRTSKNIEFDGDKFRLTYPQKSNINSTETSKIKIGSNSTKTFKNLFEGLNSADFSTIGLYCYKNTNNKLAYNEINTKTSKSTNLKTTALQSAYKKAAQKPKPQTKPKKSTNNNQTIHQNDKKRENDVPVGQIHSGQQAVALIESLNGAAGKGQSYTFMREENSGTDGSVKASDGQQVYWVRLFKDDGQVTLRDWTVFPNRTVLNGAPSLINNQNNNQNTDNNNDSDNNSNY